MLLSFDDRYLISEQCFGVDSLLVGSGIFFPRSLLRLQLVKIGSRRRLKRGRLRPALKGEEG